MSVMSPRLLRRRRRASRQVEVEAAVALRVDCIYAASLDFDSASPIEARRQRFVIK